MLVKCEYVCTAAANSVLFSPFVGVYRVNEEITCTALGYPEPSIYWESVVSNATRTVVTGPLLRITEDMVGDNSWQCRAVNVIGSTERLHRFRVLGM